MGNSNRRLAAAFLTAALLATGCSSSDSNGADKTPDTTAVATETRGEGTTYEATIRRTAGGVPHITGERFVDVAFGQGWASAEDRACDLAEQVLKVTSQRARWFGPGEEDANINSDLAWAAIDVATVAAKDWTEASDEVTELMTAYTDGWNAHLREVGTDHLAGWCAGEPWVRELEPVEVYTYARSIAVLASGGAISSMLPTAEPPTPGATGASFTGEAGQAALAAMKPNIGSNGWAVGSARSTEGGGMLLANPHFPWEGELRFWEVHLTVPGAADMYGVQLSGVPGIGIGFNENFGWTHTVSAGNRFTAYRLDLAEDSPTTYRYGDETREMTSTDVTVEVLGEDGEVTKQTHRLWRSHYGPMLNFPGFGWTESAAITYRDANIDNDEFIEQYLQTMRAKTLDDFVDLHRTIGGVPLFNTIATSSDGRAWYGDTSATPNLSDEAIAAYEASLESDPIVKIAADNGAVLLDGSDPLFEWEAVEGARDPGLVPFDEQPVLERDDYVFNANDSFWLANDEELLEGDYSPLHGRQGTPRSPRTRENVAILSDASASGPAGDDGTFTLDELADAAVGNTAFMARELLDDVVGRCRGAAPVAVEAQTADGTEVLPAAEVDITEACDVLAAWDGIYDIDRVGPPLWRETLSQFDRKDLQQAGAIFATPFDPADPVGTPSGLAPAPADGADPWLVNLARAVQILDAAGHGPDVALGDLQVANRGGTLVPIHGGDSVDGVTNIVSDSSMWSTMDPDVTGLRLKAIVPGASLNRVSEDGSAPDGDDPAQYRITFGSSFVLALAYGTDGPEAKAFLTYGNTGDRTNPAFADATEAFSAKTWRPVLFAESDVLAGAESSTTVRG